MKKLAIVGIFYDGYYDLWEDFLDLFYTYWPECPYPLYIVNNELELNFNKKYDVEVYHAGADAEYSRKVQMAVERIDADYLLLLLEDFFLGKELDMTVLQEVFNYIVSHDIKYYRMPLNEFTRYELRGKVCEIEPSMEYTLSCQPSIWRRDFLQECIGVDNYNAWVFEGIYAKSKRAHSKEFLEKCIVDYRNILSIYHGALQGKLLSRTYNHFLKEGYSFHTTRGRLSQCQERKHLLKQLVKDYMPKGLQVIIKKAKKNNSILGKYEEEIEEQIKKMGL